MRTMLTVFASLVVACWMGVAAAGGARQDPAQGLPRFRTGVEVVQMDVSVLDRDHQPVRGLAAADFTVLEDGSPQPIVAFTAIDVADRPAPSTPWLRDVAPDVTTNSVADHRLFVIVLDDAMLPFHPGMAASTKQIARGLVARLGPEDLAAVIFTNDNRHTQDFTTDHARLLAAIDAFAPAFRGATPPLPPTPAFTGGGLAAAPMLAEINTDGYYYLSSIGVLRHIAEFLSDVPMQRKVLVYISVGVPVQAGDADGSVGVDGQIRQEMSELFRQAQRSNVNVYSIDPAGLGGLEAYFQTHRDFRSDPAAHSDYLRTIAENTGGRAILDTNDVERGVTEMLRESSSYYLIAYQSPNQNADGKFRKVEVRVNRPGLTVRTRSGYDAPRPPKAGKAPAPLTSAISGLLPRTEVTMQVTVAPFAIPGKSEAALAIVANVRQPAPLERVVETIELLTSAFSPEGKLRGSEHRTARVVMRPSDADAQFEVLSRIDLKPGRYSLRLAAHSAAKNKSGSVYYDVDVPDFSKDAVSLSGVVLSATPGIASAPKDALAALIPIVPTTAREFVSDDAVTAFWRVYQGGRGPLASVALAVRIVDGQDATVFDAPQALGADRFSGTRAVDSRVELPIARLTPGPHLLTIEATIGKHPPARRDVRFLVR